MLVLGDILMNGQTELHIFIRSSLTGDRNCAEVILPHMRMLRLATRPGFVFVHDNVGPHRPHIVVELLESDIFRIGSPAW